MIFGLGNNTNYNILIITFINNIYIYIYICVCVCGDTDMSLSSPIWEESTISSDIDNALWACDLFPIINIIMKV